MRKKTLGSFELGILQFIRSHRLLDLQQPVLCAVSGGIDSMVLLSLLLDLSFPVQVLHVNFGLRGEESDQDQNLVENFCLQHGTPFHLLPVKKSDWERPDVAGQSLQMVARNLRYEWFRKTATETGISRVAVAHHADDQAETILLQVLRGGGINALTGMKPENDIFVRPLLETSRKEIAAYAFKKNIPWRQDASNLEPKYDRNRLRLEVFPLLDMAFPGFQKVLNRNAVRWQAYAGGIQFLMQIIEDQFRVSVKDEELVLDFSGLRQHPAGKLYLLERLVPLGFHVGQVEEMVATPKTGESKTWTNDSKMAWVEIRNNHLIIRSLNESQFPASPR